MAKDNFEAVMEEIFAREGEMSMTPGKPGNVTAGKAVVSDVPETKGSSAGKGSPCADNVRLPLGAGTGAKGAGQDISFGSREGSDMTGSTVVLVRIALGWLGVWLLAQGLPQPLIDDLTNDPAVHDLLAGLAGQIIGASLMGVQLLWWRVAKRVGWTT